MKKLLLSITVLMALSLFLTACATNESETTQEQTSSESETTQEVSVKTPQELSDIITSTRSDDENSGLPVIAGDASGMTMTHNPFELSEDDMQVNIQMTMESASFDLENCESYAFSVAGTIVNAYGVGIFYPTEGNEESVQQSLENFAAQKQKDFENYLPDQYEIAQNAMISTTSDGAIILVIANDAQDVMSAIEANFE